MLQKTNKMKVRNPFQKYRTNKSFKIYGAEITSHANLLTK